MTRDLVREIISQYEKHGWNLRRVLLLPEIKAQLSNSIELITGDAEIVIAEFNGAWFSRRSTENREAWELRHLSETPFALFEAIEYDADEDFRVQKQREMETRMRDSTSKI